MGTSRTQRQKGTQRKLTAILSADVVGYSRLMGDDEEATIETLTAYRNVFLSHIENHSGRVVDAKGDAILAEFASVVDAVNSAVEIQRGLAERNAELSEDRRMDFRIGINLGDVVVKDDVIYGDGVNVAARLESLADPGGICISRPVYDQVESKLNLKCEYLGEQHVKNIAKPVRAYRIKSRETEDAQQVEQPEPVSAASLLPGSISLELPDRPSIAVLPFANISGDPEQEYFSDGITEDIITDLSRLERLFVIASNSSFTYKGRHVDVRQVGQELGVRFVLEGSVRKSGERVRITAQLIDAANGEHLWAHRYDRELQDIFAVQDEITRDIAAEIEVKLVYGEQARAWHRTTSNPEAYDLALRGRQLWRRFNNADIARGRKLIEQALALDPKFAYAMVVLGRICIGEGLRERTNYQQACFDRAIELGSQALALDDTLGDAHAMLCQAYKYKGEHDRAVEHGQQAVALNPDSADSYLFFSGALQCVGRGEEAMDQIETALRLNPYPPVLYLRFLGGALLSVGRFEEAIAAFRKCLAGVPNMGNANIGLTLAFMEAGEEENARAQALQLLRIRPEFSASASPFVNSYKNPDTRERYISLLRKAGLPE
jgi:adenylate cyclase